MGSQRVKEEASEKKSEAPKNEKITVKKWKGKDWFSVISPEMFGKKVIGDIPTTDSQALIDRTLDVSLAEITGNPSKQTMKINFKIIKVEGNKALTEFNGLSLAKEQIFRIVRKGTSKIDVIGDVETTDGWIFHYKLFVILNRTSDQEIQRKVRAQAMEFIKDFASKSKSEDFIKTVCDGLMQKNVKKFGSKTYPIRFSDMVRIQVKKRGS